MAHIKKPRGMAVLKSNSGSEPRGAGSEPKFAYLTSASTGTKTRHDYAQAGTLVPISKFTWPCRDNSRGAGRDLD